jgi:heme/copper-type cytochrome/quinol oxidase subunit 3
LVATITYGVIFTFVQAYEYNVAPFSINDGVFGSLFFMLTGFHGFHGKFLRLWYIKVISVNFRKFNVSHRTVVIDKY